MTQNQIKMLLCVFQVAFISAGLYFYIFWKKIDNKPYYEQLAFVYGLILGFTELLVAIILFILMKTRVQITSLGMIGRYIRQNCYKEYYALIIINLVQNLIIRHFQQHLIQQQLWIQNQQVLKIVNLSILQQHIIFNRFFLYYSQMIYQREDP
ncbi:unnamed protein product [Paramecium sonneborni]|uniref:Transmembrane protein n=1 Tax=Paramecium sonneborni TaxID=65129 RepID=A0A8S1QVN7_9CILI|nr:unnamed protein product [Paramecium sonneborni]